MKLTVLGKYGPYAKSGTGAGSCYLVESKDAKIVLDMGPGSLSRLTAKVELKAVDAFIFSHIHYDHTSDFLAFRYLLEELKLPITVYVEYIDSDYYRLLFNHPLIKVVNIDENSVVRINGLSLRFYRMSHPIPDLAVSVECGGSKLVYTGDTVYNDNILAAAKKANLLLADCAKPAGFEGPHMTVIDAVKIHQSTGVRILATHLSPLYDPTDDLKAYSGIETAQENTVYEV